MASLTSSLARWIAGTASIVALAACSGAPASAIEKADAGEGALISADGGALGPAVDFPQVISRGGPVVKTPHIMPIVFRDDPLANEIKGFVEALAASEYWRESAAEYGVGPLQIASPKLLAPPTTNISTEELEKWLVQNLTGQAPALGIPDANVLYAVFLPPGINIQEKEGATSCKDFTGFHWEVAAGQTTIGYAVMPRCADLADLTISASHEFFEWATDPLPVSAPAFNRMNDTHWAWEATMFGELSDLCEFMDHRQYVAPGLNVPVQRQWSNVLSKAGTFPCGPKQQGPYVVGVPDVNDTALVGDYFSSKPIATKAVRVPRGQTREVDVYLYGDRPSANVQLKAQTFEELYGQQPTAGFRYAVSKQLANSGDHITLQITAPEKVSWDLVTITATFGDAEYYWPILVVNDDASTPSMGKLSVERRVLPGNARSSDAADKNTARPKLYASPAVAPIARARKLAAFAASRQK